MPARGGIWLFDVLVVMRLSIILHYHRRHPHHEEVYTAHTLTDYSNLLMGVINIIEWVGEFQLLSPFL
jgi:hypothetical protein